MFTVIAVVIFILLPLLVIFWLYRTRANSRLYLFSLVFFAFVFTSAMIFSYGYWFAMGMYWPVIFAVMLIVVTFIRFKRGLPRDWLPSLWSQEFFLIPGIGLMILISGISLPFFALSKSYEQTALELGYPLRHGTFVVMAGGANWSVNQHAYTGGISQRYALDISRLNAYGMRAAGITPDELRRYSVFGSEVISPCKGEVVETQTNIVNQPPKQPAITQSYDILYGNRVVIYCQEHSVMLNHLQADSIVVEAGELVEIGQLLARVGNSGGTMEPHLHIHAVAGRHSSTNHIVGSAAGVPLKLAGRFMVKHEWFNN